MAMDEVVDIFNDDLSDVEVEYLINRAASRRDSCAQPNPPAQPYDSTPMYLASAAGFVATFGAL